MKTLTAKQVKRLEPGTDVFRVDDATGRRARLYIVKSGRKKMLKMLLLDRLHEIADIPGMHYEVEK